MSRYREKSYLGTEIYDVLCKLKKKWEIVNYLISTFCGMLGVINILHLMFTIKNPKENFMLAI